MSRVFFHEDARSELHESAHYYEDRVQGLGKALVDDVDNGVREILENPLASPLVGSEMRRKVLRRFPFSLLYVVEPDRIRIIAVAHHKRRPEYWRYRLP